MASLDNSVTISGVPSARPELRTVTFAQVDHNYARAQVHPVIQRIRQCFPAVKCLEKHELDLCDNSLIGTGTKAFLSRLEKHFLTLAKTGSSQGLLCLTMFKHETFHLARVIEFGSLKGSCCDESFKRLMGEAIPGSVGFLRYNVFSDEDLCAKGPAKGHHHDRQFNRNVDYVKTDLGVLKDNVRDRDCCLVGVVVLTLRTRDPTDRFFWSFSRQEWDWKRMEAMLQDYSARGSCPPAPDQLTDLRDGAGLQECLDALGTIRQSFSNIPRAIGEGVLKEQNKYSYPYFFVSCYNFSKKRTYPLSLRLRLCHFLLCGQDEELEKLVHSQMFPKEQASAVEDAECTGSVSGLDSNTSSVFQEPGTSSGETLVRVEQGRQRPQKVTAARLREHYGLHVDPVDNMASNQSIFKSFCAAFQGRGQLHWMVHLNDRDVFVLNDYCCETGSFQVSSFVVCDVMDSGEVVCSCDVFKVGLVSDEIQSVCLHSRFLEEKVVPLMKLVMRDGFEGTTDTEKKLRTAWERRNEGCVPVCHSGRVLKYCVRGSNDSVAFVHLSKDHQFVKCLCGECNIKEGCKCKLQSLRSAARLCPHLNIFKAHQEIWEPQVFDCEEEMEEMQAQPIDDTNNLEDLDQEAVVNGDPTPTDEDQDCFDPETGLWNFGGFSQHRPTKEDDPISIRTEPWIKMTQQAGEDNPCDAALKAGDAEESAVPKVLREGDHSTDVIFTVEGRNLHFCKALLTMCSPVFHDLLTPEYIQQHSEGIPLPGKKYGAVAFFLQQLHPVYNAVTPVTDKALLDLLALAKEYQVEHVCTKCEQYIGSQLQLHKYEKMLTTGTLLLYLTACDQHNLTTHREQLTKFVAETTTEVLQATKFFEPVPTTALKDVYLVRCQMLEKRTEQLESDLRKEGQELASCKRRLENIKSFLNNASQSLSRDTPLRIKDNLKYALAET